MQIYIFVVDSIIYLNGEDLMDKKELMFSVQEVANIFKVSTDTIYRMVRKGQLRGIKEGRSLKFKRKEIDDFIRKIQ